MTRPMCFRLAIRALLALALVSAVAGTASAEWKEKVLYSFQGGNTDGALPVGRVVFDSKGNLYGATTQGGGQCPPAQCGTVFELTPPAKNGDPWTETVLYIFKGNGSAPGRAGSPADGNVPAGGLVMDKAGNLYGTTGYGGTGSCTLLGTKVGCGTVYELSPPTQQGGAWTETVLYSFQGGKDGYLAWGDLVFDAKGNLYGATEYGGGYGTCNSPYYQYCGTVFELSPPQKSGGVWKEKVLYSFKSGTYGANPNGGLVFDKQGAIYGTTFFGGNQKCGADNGIGCGTLFKLDPPIEKSGKWLEKVLYRFQSDPDGAGPEGGLILGTGDGLYGTTFGGGNSGLGTIFQLKRAGSTWTETVLYTFDDRNDGANPMAGLTVVKGDFYGTASVGSETRGDVFKLTPPTHKGSKWGLSVLYGFQGVPNGRIPAASLILDEAGNLYSTTQSGGSGTNCGTFACGIVFEVGP